LSYCITDVKLLVSIVVVYMYFMLPSIKAVMVEASVVLFGQRAAFAHDMLKGIPIHKLMAPLTKRILMLILIVLPEALILSYFFYTGVYFLYAQLFVLLYLFFLKNYFHFPMILGWPLNGCRM